jgi:hypothetical protein
MSVQLSDGSKDPSLHFSMLPKDFGQIRESQHLVHFRQAKESGIPSVSTPHEGLLHPSQRRLRKPE